jgi:hypothetical protein
MKHPHDTKTIDLVETAATKRGRKPLPAAEVVDDKFSLERAQAASQDATTLALQQITIATDYGDGLPYQRERVVHEARFYLAQSAEAMLEAGKRLIQIKENEPHGEFVTILTESLGLSRSSAQRMMAASVKYLSPQLQGKQSLLALGKSKLFDLMDESDEELEALVGGGTLAGHTLDEIESMSARELKAALRDRDQQIAAKDQVLADRNAKIDRLEQRLHRPYKPTAQAAARSAAEKLLLDDLAGSVIEANGAISKIVEVMTDLAGADVSASCRQAAHHDLVWLGQRLAEVMREHAIDFDLQSAVVPSWVKEGKARLAEAGLTPKAA